MYLQHFGLKHDPLGKSIQSPVDNPQFLQLKNKLDNLTETLGVGLITGEPGVGKTAGIREWIKQLNSMSYKVIYQVDNHFNPFDIYCQLGDKLGLDYAHRYCRLWRKIKGEVWNLYHDKKTTLIWVLDEAQQIPSKFFSDLPAFLNMQFDTKDCMIILLVGTPKLFNIFNRKAYASLSSRIQFHYNWDPIDDFDSFKHLVIESFKNAGCQQNIISESGYKIIHASCKGRLRYAHRLITWSLQEAAKQNMHHISDDIIKEAIKELQTMTR